MKCLGELRRNAMMVEPKRMWKQMLRLLLGVLAITLSSVALCKDKIKEGTHRVVMVVNTPDVHEIRDLVDGDKMAASGITEDSLRDGSFAVGVVYCCNQKIMQNEKVVFYVPDEMSVEFGDVVEVWIGRPANKKKKDDGIYHRAIAIRGSLEKEIGECRWNSEDERMWMNILVCDWMEEEGWVYQRGLNKSWFKPAPAD
jgi:hypothetical protein